MSDGRVIRRLNVNGWAVTIKAVPPVVLGFEGRLELAAIELDMAREGAGATEGDVRPVARRWCLCNDRADYKALKSALIKRDFEVKL